MQETIHKYTTQISDKWKSIDKALRIKIIAITVLLIIALGLTIYMTTRPKWVVFQTGADIGTIGQIQNAFDDSNIKNRIARNGTAIEVQKKDVNQAKVLLAEQNIPNEGFNFQDAVSSNSMSMSEADKGEMYLRVRENEIASLITSIDGVEAANVKLVMPNNSVLFENDQKQASASVTLRTSKELTGDQTNTIARLVAMSVENLEMKNIEISDQNATSLYSGSANDVSSFSSKEGIEKQKLKQIEMQVRAPLVQLYDDVNVISNIKFDWNKQQQRTVTYTPPIADATVGVPKTTNTESEDVENADGAQAPGTDTNNQTPANYAMGQGGASTYSGTKENNEYLYNQDERVIEISGGDVIPAQSSISVVVYKFREYNESQLRADNTINEQNTWEQFKQANANEIKLDIDPDLINSIQVGTGIDNVAVVGYEKPIFVDEVVEPVNIEQIIILAILAAFILLLAFGLIRRTKPEAVEEIEPELSVEDLLVSTQLDEKKEAERVAEIDEVESEYKRQIEKFVTEKPEAVAQLLRNWLSDDWE